MHWYLIHTKPKQEKCALLNLQQQGYECYLPTFPAERLRNGELAINDEPLFPRYLFIRLGLQESSKSWGPIRSTRGVSRLVCFGSESAKVDDRLVEHLRKREIAAHDAPTRLFVAGQRVCLADGPFAGIEGVFQMAEGERRAMVLIELLSKPVSLRVSPASLRKVG
jgi:transcriptional antiterminator RfaH